MQDAGFGPFGIAAVLTFYSLACGLVVGQAMRWDVPNPLILLAFLGSCVAWYWLSSRWPRAVSCFAWLRRLLLGPAVASGFVLVPPASNDDVAGELKARAGGEI